MEKRFWELQIKDCIIQPMMVEVGTKEDKKILQYFSFNRSIEEITEIQNERKINRLEII
jgi:hypothetical protein